MKKRARIAPVTLSLNQEGFIPMMLSIIGVIAFVIYLVFMRVASANN